MRVAAHHPRVARTAAHHPRVAAHHPCIVRTAAHANAHGTRVVCTATHNSRVARTAAHGLPVARATVEAGFSLLEVAIAAGVLLLTVAAASGLVITVLKSDALTHDRDVAAADVQNWLGTMRTLPMLPDASGGGTDSVLGRLFPHADSTRNTAAAAYIAAATPDAPAVPDAPAGAFVTRIDLASCTLRVTARFALCSGGEWVPLSPAAVAGWQAVPGLRPPALSLLLELTYERVGGGAPRRLTAVLMNPLSDSRMAAALP
jgi:hypothetical protein